MAGPDRALRAFDEIGYLQRGQTLLNRADPVLRAEIDRAVAAGDQAALRGILSRNISLSDAPATRMPDMPYDMPAKPSTDAVERRMVQGELGPIGDLPMPAVSRALDEIVAADGGDNLIGLLGGQAPRAEYTLDIFNNPSILSQANTDILPPSASVADVDVGAAVPSPPGTALIPSGPRGLSAGGGGGLIVPPGRGLATTGGPRDLSVQGMESPAPRGLPAPNQPRIEGPGQGRIEGPAQGGGGGLMPPRRLGVDDAPVPPRGRGGIDPRLIAAGIGAGAAGLQMFNEYLTSGRPAGSAPAAGPTTADLAAESAPPPRVPVASGELSPREQAHELIAKLNLMRRNAGGEVPEAPAMQREINRLLAMSNQTMAAASRGEVAMAGNDPHAQATRLLAQLNQMRREAGGEVPQARQIMAEVARLQQMGDAQRNARTTAFPRRAG